MNASSLMIPTIPYQAIQLLICITPGPAIEVTRDQLLIKPGSFARFCQFNLKPKVSGVTA